MSGLALALLLGAAPAPLASPPGASKDIAGACAGRDGWSDPAPPTHIHGRSWYVGTCGITVVLVETAAGLVLIDTGPEEAAPHVLANIRALGFEPRQVKWLLMTHEHFDHVGGMAAIQRATGARLAVGEDAAAAMRNGQADAHDPQATWLAKYPMAPVRVDRTLRHGGALVVGGTRFTLHANPTHSPGSTSWTWQSCAADQCLTVAYADSTNTISADDYHFTAHPDRIEAARAGLRVIEALPCDVLLTPHPGGSALLERLSGRAALAQPRACIAYAAGGSDRLAKRLAREAESK
ncbi:subclass B3 metallo-beta-lactamase [Novosphingobium sp.]|uniref:subclass B3 metallo-beta-lactamase n=1 Tax=Novosphingobium sp. TaxID=1874826 RepID=UPI002732C9A6|nr:subclass B3 metallo-beta-lactamase [Novosphingobium sp.]MDP3908017.1 subclass B3 metallo-beta-lactamase [Novosphingobium sp.]